MSRKTLGMGGTFDDDVDDHYTSELPNGGARVIGRGDPGTGGHAPVRSRRVEPRIGSAPEQDQEHAPPAEDTPQSSRPVKKPNGSARSNGAAGGDEVMVLNVISSDSAGFQGPDLLQVLLACDVRYGSMNIFHRHEQLKGEGQVQFSVANAVEPGTFNLDAIDEFSTPGVSFFMKLSTPENPSEAFDCMLETARCIANNLNGEILDDSMSAVTAQTLEHCRTRLTEYQRRHLAGQ